MYSDETHKQCTHPSMDTVIPQLDGIDSMDGFYTGCKFGCIHHETLDD